MIVAAFFFIYRFLFSVSLKQSANGLSEALGSLKSKIDLASNAVKVETSQEQTNIGSVDLKVSKKLKNVKMIFIVNIVI